MRLRHLLLWACKQEPAPGGGAWCCPGSQQSEGPVAAGRQAAGEPRTSQSPVAQRSPPAEAAQSWRETEVGWAWAPPESAPALEPGRRRRSSPSGYSQGRPGRGPEKRRLKRKRRRKTARRSEEAMLRPEERRGCQEMQEVRPSLLEVSVEVPAEAAWGFLCAGSWRGEEEEEEEGQC